MATNVYFNQAVKSEQLLYEDIIIESLKMYGQDVVYLPRELTNEDKIFGDDTVSRFERNYKIEMYIEGAEGFDGEGDLFSKFGVEIRDEATFIVARRRWDSLVASKNNQVTFYRPREGDLIYLPLSSSIFQIQKVETETPFYQLSNLPTFKIRASLFEYNDEDMDTGIVSIDAAEKYGAYNIALTLADSDTPSGFVVGETVTQTFGTTTMSGEISELNDSDNIIYLAHVGKSDGTFGVFDVGSITGGTSEVTATVTLVTERNNINPGNQNADFSDGISDFMDFSETNPFGDIS
jgi:hypothetical protein